MKAFALIFNDGREVEQDFLDQVEASSMFQNWLYIHPIIFLVSDLSAHVLAEAIHEYDPKRWFFITEIALGANNGIQPHAVWDFLNSPQSKYTASSKIISKIVASIPASARPPSSPPRPAKPTPPTLPGTNKPLKSLRKQADALRAALDALKDKK
jgi:hypothetical protein